LKWGIGSKGMYGRGGKTSILTRSKSPMFAKKGAYPAGRPQSSKRQGVARRGHREGTEKEIPFARGKKKAEETTFARKKNNWCACRGGRVEKHELKEGGGKRGRRKLFRIGLA